MLKELLAIGAAAIVVSGCAKSEDGAPGAEDAAPRETGDEAAADAAHDAALNDIRGAAGARIAAGAPVQSARMASASPNGGALPPGALLMQTAEIVDASGFDRPLVAARVLIPDGWRTQGGVVWGGQNQCADPFTFQWAATSPDGSKQIAMGPADGWQASTTESKSNCRSAAFQSARDYLIAYVSQFPGGRVLDYRDRPEFAKAANDRTAEITQMAAQMGIDLRAWAEGGEVLYAFDANGREMRGTTAVTVTFYASEIGNPMGGPTLRTITGATSGTFSATAPDGELDFRLAEAVRKSVRAQAEWAEKIAEFRAKMGGIAVEETRKRAEIIVAGGAAMTANTIAANQAAVSRAAANSPTYDGYKDTAATDERMQRERLEALTGVETYYDPVKESTVQLDHTYDHAWRVTNKDAYILTNDPNFNPGLYNIEAQQLPVVQ